MSKKVAIGLLIASLVLLIIYGADVMIALSGVVDRGIVERRGFLPFDESVRGGAFGGGAVVMSIIAFVIARKESAPAVSALLFVNGGLIIAGMLLLIAQGALASTRVLPTIASTMAMGGILLGLGAWKVALDKKLVTTSGREPTQK